MAASPPLPPLPELPAEGVFGPDECTVVYVMGGPGVGKGTQCALLAARLGFVHLSAGDLLRAERGRPGSPYAEVIRHYICEGRIIPQRITIALLLAAMRTARSAQATSGCTRFLIDGFPRDVAQGLEFEERVASCSAMVFYDCPQDVLLERLGYRAQTSGRSDDNAESVIKRLNTYAEITLPVRESYSQRGLLLPVDSTSSIEDVFAATVAALSSSGIL